MSDYANLCRLRAYETGTALALGSQRHAPISEAALLITPLLAAGENPSLFAIGVAQVDGPLQVFTCANPPDRNAQYAMLLQFALAVIPTITWWDTDPAVMPQLIFPSDAAMNVGLANIYRMAYAQDPHLQQVGRALMGMYRRNGRADNAAIVSVVNLVNRHFAVGTDELAASHLGVLEQWLLPADGQIHQRVRLAEVQPAGAATDPALDRNVLEPLLKSYRAASSTGNAGHAKTVAAKLVLALEPEVRRLHTMALGVLARVNAIPQSDRAQAMARGERAEFDRHMAHVATNAPVSSGFNGNQSVIEYLSRSLAQAEHEVSTMREAGRERVEARLAGESLHGIITARRETKAGARTYIDIEVQTPQPRLKMRSGKELELLSGAYPWVFTVTNVQMSPNGPLVTLRMKEGMTKTGQPVVGDSVELAPTQHFSRRIKNATIRLATQAPRPVVSSPSMGGTDFLAVIASLKGITP